MIDLKAHLTSSSPNYDVYTFNFNKSEIEELEEALLRKSLIEEIQKLVNEEGKA